MKKIFIIQTGGTIAMSSINGKTELDAEAWNAILGNQFNKLSNIAEIDTQQLFFENSFDLNHSHWLQIIRCIETNYGKYDGFVVLHGTDTMAYTASAVSFALHNLQKTVVFTGSQVPMSNPNTDAKNNIFNAIKTALLPLNEVVICFNSNVYRANRASKIKTTDFDAFHSFNFPVLGTFNPEFEANNYNRIVSKGDFSAIASFSDALQVIFCHPSVNTDYLNYLDLNSIRAVLLIGYGSGNMPTKFKENLLPYLERCIENNILVAITSQANYNAVNLTKYPAGRKAAEIGAIGCVDMTFEASLTKLMYLLAQYEDRTKIEALMQTSLKGELSAG